MFSNELRIEALLVAAVLEQLKAILRADNTNLQLSRYDLLMDSSLSHWIVRDDDS